MNDDLGWQRVDISIKLSSWDMGFLSNIVDREMGPLIVSIDEYENQRICFIVRILEGIKDNENDCSI